MWIDTQNLIEIDKQAFGNISQPYNDDMVIWRYFTLVDFISQIGKGVLRFPNVKTYKDKAEATLSTKSAQITYENLLSQDNTPVIKNKAWEKSKGYEKFELWDEDSKIFAQKRRSFEYMINDSIMYLMYTCSWIQSDYENKLMWDVYGQKSPTCIALKTTIKELRQSFVKQNIIKHIGKVNYVDYQKDHLKGYENYDHIDFKNIQKVLELYYSPILHKQKEYQSENEIRIVVSYPFISKGILGSFYINNIPYFRNRLESWGIDRLESYNRGWPKWFTGIRTKHKMAKIEEAAYVSIDTSKLLKEIYISPYSQEYHAHTLADILKHYIPENTDIYYSAIQI